MYGTGGGCMLVVVVVALLADYLDMGGWMDGWHGVILL